VTVARLAALDVGTNSTRLLVADVDGGRMVAELDREMIITRLGKGVDRIGRFDPAALRRTLDVLAGYAATCRRLRVKRSRVVATSATRDAANRQELLDGVRQLFGVEAEVLTGQAEAATAYRGATHDLPGGGRTLVVDIGGGSTELILGTDQRPAATVSLELGCVRLHERHLHTDPPTAAEISALRADAAAQLARVTATLDPASADRVVGVAGTITTVTAIGLGLEAYDPARIHHAALSAPEIAAVADKLAAMTVAERAAIPVMAKGREDVIAAGALLLDELVRTFRFPRVIASETDILDGVLLGLADRGAWQHPPSPGRYDRPMDQSTPQVPDSHRDLLEQPLSAYVATVGTNGGPQVSPMWFWWDGDRIRLTHTRTRQKFRNLQAEPRIALTVADPAEPQRYLELRGVVETVEDDAGGAFYRRLRPRYGVAPDAPMPDADVRVVLVVRPTAVLARSPATAEGPPAIERVSGQGRTVYRP
jgi:exopolyphosphatase/guanosine-5'-triphosphate,3'-diphosphate pyrophosphatase